MGSYGVNVWLSCSTRSLAATSSSRVALLFCTASACAGRGERGRLDRELADGSIGRQRIALGLMNDGSTAEASVETL
jgi:hypothetical protein